MITLHRLLLPLVRRAETVAHPLRYLFLEITQRCNLACRHCGSDCGRAQNPDELTSDEWLAFLAQLSSRLDRSRVMLVLTGGEPLCHPALEPLLGALRRHGYRWSMVSNGYNLGGEALTALLAHGMCSLTVSLDGLEASHDWLRGKSGSFARAVRAIELSAHASRADHGKGALTFDVVTCVHPGNLGELLALHQLLGTLGVRHWRLFSIFAKGRAVHNRELLLGRAGLQQLFGFIRQARATANTDLPAVTFSCEAYLPPALDQAVRDMPYFCRAGINIASVLCDGAISACPNISRALVQGNVRTDDFMQVWNERFERFRDREWLRQGHCVGCRDWSRCLGNSLHLWHEGATEPVCSRALVESDADLRL